MPELLDLMDQTAIVTGASGAIGGAIAVELGSRGAHVFATATNNKSLLEMTGSLAQEGFDFTSRILDLSQRDSIPALVKEAEERNGAVQIVVNNGGITRDGLEMRMPDEDWDDVIAVNLSGAHFLTKAAERAMMKARYGRIVNVTSVVGLTGNPGQTNYAASKAGLIGLTKSQAKELASRGITVNAVAPGYVVSGLTEVLPDDAKKKMIELTPIGRTISPEEVAAAVGFLASPRASGITAEVLRVDGGIAA